MQSLKLQQLWLGGRGSGSVTAPDQSKAKVSKHIFSVQTPVSCTISISRNGKVRQYHHGKRSPSKELWQLASDLLAQRRGALNWRAAGQCEAMLIAPSRGGAKTQPSCALTEKKITTTLVKKTTTAWNELFEQILLKSCPAFDVLCSRTFSSRYAPASGEGAGCSTPLSSLLARSCLHTQQALSSLWGAGFTPWADHRAEATCTPCLSTSSLTMHQGFTSLPLHQLGFWAKLGSQTPSAAQQWSCQNTGQL